MRLLLLLPFLSLAVAEKLKIARHLIDDCLWSCMTVLNMATFGDIPPEAGYYDGKANSKWFLTSMHVCLTDHCTTPQIDAGWAEITEYALEYGDGAVLPPFEEVGTWVPADVPTVSPINDGVMYNQTVRVNEEDFDIGFRTIDSWDMVDWYHHSFGYSIYILLAVMLLFGMGSRFLSWLAHRPIKTGEVSNRSEVAPSTSTSSNMYIWYRRYFETPALFGHRHSSAWGRFFSIPTRFQAFFIFVYVLLNVVYCAIGYEVFDGNLYFPGPDGKSEALWRYISDRTGIICFYNLPLLWALAGRNDVVLWVTGWSYSSMNLFHRWVARVATAQAVVHSIGYTWLEREYLAEMWAELYWRTGVWATIFMCLLVFPLSCLPLRQYWYEIFLIVHILFAAVTIPMLWYHVAIFDGAYDGFLWGCIGVWVFDRVLRIVRLQVLSYNCFKGDNAVAILTGNDNGLIRLTVNTPFKIKPKAGEYYFLYNPISLTPWENHPFTLASWEQEEKSTKLHFLIAVQSGATKRLRRKMNANESTCMKVLLEGPYGHTEPIERYEHVLFVAGGSGITAMLPYLEKVKQNPLARSATVVWSVKNNAYASDVLATELSASGAEVHLHVTEEEQPAITTLKQGEQPLEEAAEDTNKELAHENKSTSSGSTMNVQVGRPVMADLVASHVKKLVGSERLAIVSCGPSAMMDDMRKAVSEVYGTGEGQVNGSAVDYFEELFSW